jgi:hypothetical protein
MPQPHGRDTQLGRRVHRTPELPAHGFRPAGADLPGLRRAAARSSAQKLHPGAAGVGTGTDAETGAWEGFELLRQVWHPHHRGRQVLPGMWSPVGPCKSWPKYQRVLIAYANAGSCRLLRSPGNHDSDEVDISCPRGAVVPGRRFADAAFAVVAKISLVASVARRKLTSRNCRKGSLAIVDWLG